VNDPRSFDLPDHYTEALHFIRVELDFSDTVSSLAEITFGGAFADDVSTELTAVPIFLGESDQPPESEALRGVSRKSSRPLSVVAVEKGPAVLLAVLDESAKEALLRFGKLNSRDLEHLIAQEYVNQTRSVFARGNSRELKKIARSGSARKVSRSFLRERAELSSDLQLQFLWPFAERQERLTSAVDVFHSSKHFTSEDGGLYWILIQAEPSAESSGPQRLADAVASAAVLVARRNRRRAVILILGEDPVDASYLRPAQVQRYLELLRVPLFVWSTGNNAGNLSRIWLNVTQLSSFRDLERAVKHLQHQLERQRIVWIDGVHLPQDIVISSADSEFSLAQ
ncbi:MAG: hypothetical protein V3S30_06270, partial [Thermoanaerobaculia bacterium]